MQTIPGVLKQTAHKNPDLPAIVDNGTTTSYRDLQHQVLKVAAALQAKGLSKEDKFAIWAPNCAEWIVTALAGQTLGGVLVTLNTRYKGSEAADIIRRSECKLLLTVDGFLGLDYPSMIEGEDLPDLQETIILRDKDGNDGFQNLLSFANAPLAEEALDYIGPDDPSDIIFTSGTTGLPKGAVTHHGQNISVFDVFTNAIDMQRGDRYLVVNPFFHSFGYKAGWLSCLIRAATIYPLGVFDPGDVLRRIEEDSITVMPGAPTIFQTIMDHPDFDKRDLSSLRLATTGATVIPVDLIRKMHEVIGIDHVYSAYGLTETCGVVSLCRKGDDFETIATTVGRPLPETEVILVDEDGNQVDTGEEGEIWVRGFNTMQGYLDAPEDTAHTITSDGWLKTGDVGTMDDKGYLRITDRKKDMIIVGGFNAYPAEIEKWLMQHPDVIDAAVIGMADDRLGEVPQAFIIARTPDIETEALMTWIKERISNFKVPRKITVLEDLPRNASGKVQKYLLEEM